MRSALNLFDSLFAIGLIQIPMWKPAACSNPREIDWNGFSGQHASKRRGSSHRWMQLNINSSWRHPQRREIAGNNSWLSAMADLRQCASGSNSCDCGHCSDARENFVWCIFIIVYGRIKASGQNENFSHRFILNYLPAFKALEVCRFSNKDAEDYNKIIELKIKDLKCNLEYTILKISGLMEIFSNSRFWLMMMSGWSGHDWIWCVRYGCCELWIIILATVGNKREKIGSVSWVYVCVIIRMLFLYYAYIEIL